MDSVTVFEFESSTWVSNRLVVLMFRVKFIRFFKSLGKTRLFTLQNPVGDFLVPGFHALYAGPSLCVPPEERSGLRASP